MHLVSWDNAVNRDRAELIFSNRNHEYGGYVIRRDYEKIMVYALLYTLAAIVLVISIPVIIRMTAEPLPVVPKAPDGPIVWVDQPPVAKPIPPPQPLVSHPPAGRSLIYKPTEVMPETTAPDPPATETGDGIPGEPNTPAGPPSTVFPAAGIPIEPVDPGPVMFPTEMPVFEGGDTGLRKYLAEHIKYPDIARENRIEGIVYISFVVNKEGNVVDAKILHGIGGGCNEEALRVVNSLPQWKPGRQNGRLVSVIFNVPVRFSLK